MCECWRRDAALGHDGHCCFFRDDRDRRVNGGWRPVEEICHRPTPGERNRRDG
jgi:hypothetical protein